MKKYILFLFCIFNISLSLYSEQKLFSFSAGLSSGWAFIGDEESKKNDAATGILFPANFGAVFEVSHNPIEEVTFFAGTDIFMSFNAASGIFSNHICLNIPFGIKIYPHLMGFCFGAAYSPGFKRDYYKNSTYDFFESEYLWGNGFKLLLEYNFAKKGMSPYYPTIGFSWTFTPRKNYIKDNILSLYAKINF